MQLNSAQKAAVEYLEGPLLVLAGPGTGKTQLLSTRVAHILQVTDTAPENILCLTFTENGADNMRERLLSLIGPEAAKIHIGTYHAFGQVVLAEYKKYATTPERQFENAIDEVLQFKIIREIQTNLPARDILRGDRISDIVDTVNNAKSAGLTATDLATIAEANTKASQEINLAVAPILAGVKPRMKFAEAVVSVYQPLMEVLAQFTGGPIVGNIEPAANIWLRDLNHVIEVEGAKEKPSVSPLTKWRKDHFVLDDAGNYILSDRVANLKLASLARVMASYDEHLRQHGLYDFADMIMEAIRCLREDRGFRLTLSERFQYILLDEFQDTNATQFEIIKLLTDYESPQVMAVGDDDQAIFEFQGANASNLLDFQNYYQAKTITLTENYRSSSEILQFSHRVAEQITESFAHQHHVDKLLTARGVWADASQQISRHEFISADAENYWVASQVRALLDAGEDPAEIAIITPKHKYIAPLLPYLRAQHIDIAYEKREDILKDPRIHELATLARFCHELAEGRNPAHRLLEVLSFAFWQVDPLVAVQAVSAHRREPALEILQKSGQPQLQEIATLLAALTTQSFYAPLELWLDWAIGTTPLPSAVAPASRLATQTTAETTAPAAKQATAKTAAPVVEQATTATTSKTTTRKTAKHARELRSPFLTYYTSGATNSDYDTFSLYENLASLRAALVRHLQNPQPTLADLIEFLDDYELAGAGVLNTSPYRDSSRSVQVMTAFKSKGLEFRHVFLTAVDSISWGRGKGNNNLLALPKNLLQIRHTTGTDDERLRVFFVALTRAKETLTLTNAVTDFSGKSPRRLEYLAEAEHTDEHGQHYVISPFLPSENQRVIEHTADLESAKALTDLQTAWSGVYQSDTPEFTAYLREKMRRYRVSATDLTKFIDLIYAGPADFYLSRVLGRPSEPPTPSIVLGNLIHAVFERITNSGISDKEALDCFLSELEMQPLLESDLNYLRDRGRHALEVSLAAFREILRDPTAVGEVNLGLEQPTLTFAQTVGALDANAQGAGSQAATPSVSGAKAQGTASAHTGVLTVPLTGKIDHLSINRDTHEIEIYDFKTGKFRPEAWDRHPSLYKYKLQLGFYKLLVNHSRSYPNYTVTRGHILFVDPDQDDRVHQKTYVFNDDDEATLCALVHSFYQHATSLDFVHDPDLMLEPDKSRTIKDIRNFIQHLIEEE